MKINAQLAPKRLGWWPFATVFRLLSQIGFPIQPTQIRSNGDQGWSPALTMRYPSSKKSAKIENRANFSIFSPTLCEAGLNAAENKKIRDYFLIPHRSVVQDRDNSSSIKRKLRLKLILMIIPGMYNFFKKFWKKHQIIKMFADKNRSILDLYWNKLGDSDLIQSILDFFHFHFSDFWIAIFRKTKILKSWFSTFWPRLFYFSSSVRESS